VSSCEFLNRGLNDTFRVQTAGGRFVFRVYRQGWRSRSEILFELDVLGHCDRAGVPVATPLARRDGEFISSIEQPEGSRYAVMFTYAEGAQLGNHSETQARSFGAACAHLHRGTHDFSSPHPRFVLDLQHLIEHPLSTIIPFLQHRREDHEYLARLASRVAQKIDSVQSDLDFGLCHGDLHGVNAAFDGDKITMFDFDCGGLGWRAYDIAVYRWALQIQNLPQNWQPFRDAYRERRELREVDLDALPWLVAARHLWLLGLHTANAEFLGRGVLGDSYWDFWLKLVHDCEAKELKD
jgi:Ser/Thr protein kinase RdoA (MazF antagonist)